MSLLQRYIAKTVINSILMVTLMLIGLQIFIVFISQLGDLGRGDYGILHAFIYVLYTLPLEVYVFFPLAALLGCLLGLGSLASHSELIVMRMAGVSIGQISWAVIKGALLLVLAVTLVGEVIGPLGAVAAENQKAMAMSGGQTVQTKHGVWFRDGDNFIHINTILPGNRFLGVIDYHFNKDHVLDWASYAQSATFDKEGNWVLHNVNESIITTSGVTVKHYDKMPWSVSIQPKMLGIDAYDPIQLPLVKLYRYIEYRNQNNLQSGQYQLVLWQRIIQPFATMIMIFLAIPFIFGPLRTVTMHH